ncbi:hypothetical protein A5669_27245 [Mycolicibacterium fortuitum]|nr:hypothetical protein A5669_27245 [Mycolicibacterium fortuitum]
MDSARMVDQLLERLSSSDRHGESHPGDGAAGEDRHDDALRMLKALQATDFDVFDAVARWQV